MKTELILYKSNVLKNWNFNNANNAIDNDTLAQIVYWETNGLWSLTGGQAVCIVSDGSLLEQKGLIPNTQYKVKVNVASLTGTLTLNVGINNYLISSIGITEISYNTGTGDSISFEVSSGDDATLNWVSVIEEPTVMYIDQIDDLSVPVTYSIADIRDISKRNGSFTRTINIPGSTNNNLVFNQIFEIDGECNFNPNKKIKAILKYEGDEQLNGYLQLKNINRNQIGLSDYNLISYQVTIIGGIGDIFKDMGETLLSELGFDEYAHSYTALNQELTWNGGITKNGVYTPNWVNGFSQSATDVDIDGNGRVVINFAVPHGFVKDDQVYVNFADPTAIDYNGDQRVFEVPTSTSIVLYYPYIPGTSTLTGANFVFKHEPTGDGYVYPMIFQGVHTDNTIQNGINWYIKDFIPAVYLKTFLNKIETRFGYTFVSSLFDSVNFKRLILNAAIKDFKQSYAQLNHNAFQATKTTNITKSITYNYHSPPILATGFELLEYDNSAGSFITNTYNMVYDDDFTLPNFDNANTYNVSTGLWNCPVTANYKLSTTFKLNSVSTLPVGFTDLSWTTTNAVYSLNLTINIKNYTTNTIIDTKVKSYPFRTMSTFNDALVFNSIQFQGIAGNDYGIEVILVEPNGFYIKVPIGTTGIPATISSGYEIEIGATYFNEPIATSFAEGDTIDIVSAIPKMTCKDFFNTLIKMFNLYIEPDKDNSKILYIEPRNDYYSNNKINWTDKLDLNETILLQPMAELNAKTYEYKFKDDEAALNKDHKSGVGYGYGDRIKIVDNDFLTSKNTTEVNTAAGVLIDIPNNGDRIITGIYGSDGSALTRIDGNPRILYFGLAATTSNWNHLSQSGGTSYTNRRLYPYAGHLDKVRGPKFDFNFGYPVQMYYTSDQWTSANLYNLYYRDMINEIISPKNKLITCNLYLKPSDISNLSFKNVYIIDGHHLRLNKITDFVPGSDKSTKCEFTRIESISSFTNTHMRYNGKTFVDNTLDGEQLPSIKSMRNSNSLLNTTIRDYGFNNTINLFESTNILVKGNNNRVGQSTTNISIIDSDNVFIYGGLSNVSVIGTSNITITQSNTTVVNGLTINNGVIQNNGINFISAGVNQVLSPFNNYTTVNLINAGKDNILGIGGVNLINNVNAGTNKVI